LANGFPALTRCLAILSTRKRLRRDAVVRMQNDGNGKVAVGIAGGFGHDDLLPGRYDTQ